MLGENGMNDSNKRMVKLENQLAAQIQKGNPGVIKRMTPEQAKFVREVLHYEVHPYLYEIQTKRIENNRSAMWLLKEIHRAYKNGKKTICKKLRAKEVDVLTRESIKFQPVKYRVVFNVA